MTADTFDRAACEALLARELAYASPDRDYVALCRMALVGRVSRREADRLYCFYEVSNAHDARTIVFDVVGWAQADRDSLLGGSDVP
jgi:hypothetical protein